MFYYFGVTRGALCRVMGAEAGRHSEHPGIGVNVIARAGAVPPEPRPESSDYLGRGDSELKRITLPCHLT